MVDDTHVLKCIILTLKRENVLVPSAVVAEIISVEDVEKVPDSPGWLMGKFKWRGEDVPLLSFEAAEGGGVSSTVRSTQVAVLYVLNDDSDIKTSYIGLIISGVPHVNRFASDQIVSDDEALTGHFMVAQRVKVNGVPMSILDIDAMETMVVESNYQG